jgi:murein DD-endopeptidase MepM/ murein hydrolase activator NlpD
VNLRKKTKNRSKFIIAMVLGSLTFLIIGGFSIIIFLLLGSSKASLEQYQQSQALDQMEWILSEQGKAMIPAQYLAIYQQAGQKYGVPWNLLAAIHKVETDFGRNLKSSWAGAVGHTQFMPCNWIGWSYYEDVCTPLGDLKVKLDITDPKNIHGGQGIDANGDGKADPNDPEDSIHATARRLSRDKEKTGKDWFERGGPVWRYNPSMAYVEKVKSYFNLFATAKLRKPPGMMHKGGKFPWPTVGRITGSFGEWRGDHMHAGIDIGAPMGNPIYSVEDGVVILSKENPGGYGWYVVIRHGQMGGKTIDTLYGHMYPETVEVKVGDKVKKGQRIAKVGNNGRSSGPHLHFEVKINGKATNPINWISK